ncbi:hypothetical protein PI95_029010 [Hassallia byssoidea VB512170]|uniref:Uncharacterized protein n=1 Tax=Hassallia byssoidea VB512170 TaxID=1304833 RepID=A0A846HGH1_9CYAN|nr:hypothetical protein [Hassalia byssoidea]NEU76446.1 hypothetical protein [Hassalia byssoidea VB512170]
MGSVLFLLPITHYQLPLRGSPVAHGGNEHDRAGSPIPHYQLPITN